MSNSALDGINRYFYKNIFFGQKSGYGRFFIILYDFLKVHARLRLRFNLP